MTSHRTNVSSPARKRSSLAPIVLTGGIAALICTQSVSADPIVTTDATTGAYTVSSTDLINGITGTTTTPNLFGVTNAGDLNFTTTNLGVLTDGVFGSANPNNDTGANATTVGVQTGAVLTYDLNLATNVNGYSISDISIYAGWQDGGRVNQDYTVYYSTVNAPNTWIQLTNVNYAPPGIGAPVNDKVDITDSTGTVATGVAAIQFDFGTQQNGYVGYREIDVTGTALAVGAPLTWTGGVNGTWDYSTQNWTPGTGSTIFSDGSPVIFDNTGAHKNVIVSNGGNAVSPAGITVNNSGTGNDYTIGGDPLGGPAGLTKTGSGQLTLTGANTFSGPVSILNGTVNVSSIGDASTPGNLGQGSVINIGDSTGSSTALLNYTGSSAAAARTLSVGADGGTVSIAPGATLTLSTLASVSNSSPGTLTQSGPGTLAFNSASGSFSGSFVVQQGGISIAAMASGPGSSISLGSIGASSFTYSGPGFARRPHSNRRLPWRLHFRDESGRSL